jgi:Suppressor of fused protein (SUFU)
MEALYVTLPVYFPNEFFTSEEESHTVVIAWLVPISASEAHYIVHHGWADFEDRLAEQDPDLTDFGRQPILLQPETELENTSRRRDRRGDREPGAFQ